MIPHFFLSNRQLNVFASLLIRQSHWTCMKWWISHWYLGKSMNISLMFGWNEELFLSFLPEKMVKKGKKDKKGKKSVSGSRRCSSWYEITLLFHHITSMWNCFLLVLWRTCHRDEPWQVRWGQGLPRKTGNSILVDLKRFQAQRLSRVWVSLMTLFSEECVPGLLCWGSNKAAKMTNYLVSCCWIQMVIDHLQTTCILEPTVTAPWVEPASSMVLWAPKELSFLKRLRLNFIGMTCSGRFIFSAA